MPLAAPTAWAQGASAQTASAQGAATVDVRGKFEVPRSTLSLACPHAATELPDALASTARDVAEDGLVSVRFEIEGSRLHQLQVQGGAARQTRAVARAVRNLGCSNGQAGRQVVQFQVRFLDPYARAPGHAVEVRDPG
jgi:hypothetical protein